ncbi:hypothetical protein [Sphingopyxis yananensis]|uniref:hypothetical protein n=1 Tax=Sphingopyxis yananensis TaxID=2886687 RepID=UPI001D11D237|nr:hypothetical protein [Sphingopyxis yananensis]MCC2601150.1 hypothetical protein [Sphingopyxis yananensis]
MLQFFHSVPELLMPRKCRAAETTLAEAFLEWFDSDLSKRKDWSGLSRVQDPDATWEVDKFVSFLLDDGSCQKIRSAVSRCWMAAVFRTKELYQRRQEIEQHQQRREEAEILAASLQQFLARRNKDIPALGFRSEKLLYEPQIPWERQSGAQADWLAIEANMRELVPLLGRFVSDRTQLKQPPSDRSDILGMIFIGNIEHATSQLFRPMSDAETHRFILAAWRDVGMPLPERDQANVPASWTSWMDKKLIAWQKMAPEKKRAIGFSQED